MPTKKLSHNNKIFTLFCRTQSFNHSGDKVHAFVQPNIFSLSSHLHDKRMDSVIAVISSSSISRGWGSSRRGEGTREPRVTITSRQEDFREDCIVECAIFCFCMLTVLRGMVSLYFVLFDSDLFLLNFSISYFYLDSSHTLTWKSWQSLKVNLLILIHLNLTIQMFIFLIFTLLVLTPILVVPMESFKHPSIA